MIVSMQFADNWNLNQKYWSFGRKYVDNGDRFGWCPSGNITIGWDKDQPNPNLTSANCVQLTMKVLSPSLVNANCSTPLFFACEVGPRFVLEATYIYNFQGGTTPAPIVFPAYPAFKCPVDVWIFNIICLDFIDSLVFRIRILV
jgi:hypothetical protein